MPRDAVSRTANVFNALPFSRSRVLPFVAESIIEMCSYNPAVVWIDKIQKRSAIEIECKNVIECEFFSMLSKSAQIIYIYPHKIIFKLDKHN